jgi:hypothetical protein
LGQIGAWNYSADTARSAGSLFASQRVRKLEIYPVRDRSATKSAGAWPGRTRLRPGSRGLLPPGPRQSERFNFDRANDDDSGVSEELMAYGMPPMLNATNANERADKNDDWRIADMIGDVIAG